MKILVVTPIYPPEVGGPATYVSEIQKRLLPKFDVTVVGFTNQKLDVSNNVRLVSTHGGTLVRQLRLFRACLGEGRGADVFFLQEPAVVGLVGLVAGKVMGKRLIVKYVGDPEWEERARGGKPMGFLFLVTRLVLNLVDRVIVPAKYLEALLENYYGVAQGRLVVIPNSVEMPKARLEKISGRLIFAGRLVPWKNVELIIKVVSKLLAKGVKASLVIVGEGPERDRLEKLAEELGLGKVIRFSGRLTREQAGSEIGRSEILVLFSGYEGLSHVILEAMAGGAVVVASDIAGNREVVHNGKTGLLVPPGNVDGLARAIGKLLKDKNLREKLAKEGKREVEEKYSWKVNLHKLGQVFDEVSQE